MVLIDVCWLCGKMYMSSLFRSFRVCYGENIMLVFLDPVVWTKATRDADQGLYLT